MIVGVRDDVGRLEATRYVHDRLQEHTRERYAAAHEWVGDDREDGKDRKDDSARGQLVTGDGL